MARALLRVVENPTEAPDRLRRFLREIAGEVASLPNPATKVPFASEAMRLARIADDAPIHAVRGAERALAAALFAALAQRDCVPPRKAPR